MKKIIIRRNDYIDENGVEFWYARELMEVLSYKDWRYFDAVIEKAKVSCQNSGITDIDHFVASNKMVEIGSSAKRKQKDYKLKGHKSIIYFNPVYIFSDRGDGVFV